MGIVTEFDADFINWFIERGYEISFRSPKDDNLSLFELGERAYDHLLLLPLKSKGLGPSLTSKALLDFINAEGNILVSLSGGQPTPNAISSLLLELDLVLSPARAPLIVDHFNYDTISASEKHDVLLLQQPNALRSDVKSYFGGDGVIAFPRAAGQAFGASSTLIAPILRAPATAYSIETKEEDAPFEDAFPTGSQIALVSSMQARNNARVTVLGSVESLQDKWFGATVQGLNGEQAETRNRVFAKQLSSWTFQETGVLKVGKIDHHPDAESEKYAASSNFSGQLNPLYRIKSGVVFTIQLSEYVGDHWAPFETPEDDAVQLEFTLLSPFYRINLVPLSRTANSTIYGTNFTIPDQHGIFSFRINYKRPFLSNIEEKHEVTVRHFAHDEFPRSFTIRGAYPWIAGMWSVIAGFILFVIVWLYSAPAEPLLAKKEAGVRKKKA
ncbi:oligosaccharyl transferase glycoprotein complex, beta subunit [Ascosphaera aggregata]|nr:oligosaccharyl transferase glycoprotein complex, beta subunit [Ascosphaera aggregata]